MLSPDGYYDYSVDMWATGCILGELLRRKPLFPGRNFVQQLVLIVDALGKPNEIELQKIKSYEVRRFLSTRSGDKHGTGIKALIPEVVATPEALSLLHSLLAFNPDCRLTAEEALEHAFIASSTTCSTMHDGGSNSTSGTSNSTLITTLPPLSLEIASKEINYEHPKLSLRDLRGHLMLEVVASRKMKEEKLGMQPLKGCLVNSTSQGNISTPAVTPDGADEEGEEAHAKPPVVPTWPTKTATASGSTVDENAWSEGGDKAISGGGGGGGAEAPTASANQREGWIKWWRHYYRHQKQKKEEEEEQLDNHRFASFLLAMGGKGGASVGIGMLAVLPPPP